MEVRESYQDYQLSQRIKAELGENPDPDKVLLMLNDLGDAPPLPEIKKEYRCACGHLKSIADFPIVNTGVCNAVYNICPECVTHAEKVSHLCCFTCKEVYAHVEPGAKDKSGFKFEPGKFYHSKHCPTCTTAGKSNIAEMLVFYKRNKIPYNKL